MTTSASKGSPGGVRILDRLRDDGRITAPQYESFYHQAKRTGERIEESILESGAMSEADLLKFVASLYKTRFVSTERLSKAEIDRATLDLVPRRLAERLQCVPILYDRRAQVLSVVTYELEEDVGKQLAVATGAREVRVFAARPATVRAALRRFYGGDPHAFAQVQGAPASYALGLDAFERGSGGGPSISLDPTPRGGISLDLELDDRTPAIGFAPAPPAPARPAAPARAAPPTPPELKIEMPRFEVAPDWAAYLETVNVLVTVLDGSRAELRGHSSQVARLCGQLADRLSISGADRHAIVLAGYLHDVGKASSYHLTALNVSRFDGHRLQAQRSHLSPLRMFESARLPPATIDALTHLYERYDGQGFPDRQAGNAIPIGARIVSLVETYCDLTVNPKNPYRRTLSPREALDVLRQLGSQLFDPGLVGALRQVVVGDETSGKNGARTRVLIVDPEREETTMLELRLAEAGHGVVVVRDRAEATAAITKERFQLIVSELELGGEDGFALLGALRAEPSAAEIPFVFLTRKADRESVARGFELGAADFLVKPASAELVVAKTAQLIEAGVRRRGGGLAGNLRDISLPDVIQALGNGRKTGLLHVSAGGTMGEIHFLEGAIADARFGQSARQEAIYAMLALKEGEFSLDPAFKPTARVINESTEALLLEGMRRMDEAGIG
ncbi:DUF4388 domain-containing protein [Sandaracinus amylolyticus]|uniref:DUF4388 domain-containing protein n=1 Tax=Sandaracinus amylolyticus TaxID=927083 RepID=UPI001F2D10F8|nr:DUF4388 domain-containing protein [Sandaracinus amylolyticus]UJR82756.1 Hypothetical protein I5071_48210 [Sandaracinus amylolyticus]